MRETSSVSSPMSPETSAKTRSKLKGFDEFVKEKMSPDEWAWFSNWRPKQSLPESKVSADD